MMIQPHAHWSESYCFSYLQHRISELEQELQQRDKQLVELVQEIAFSQQSDLRHNFSVMNFQFGRTKLAVNIGNTEQAAISGKTLASAGIEILKQLGFWDIEENNQKEFDKQIAKGLTKGS